MKIYLSLLVLGFTMLSHSQKLSYFDDIDQISPIQKTSIYNYVERPQSTQLEDVMSFLVREYDIDLEPVFMKESPVAHYYMFQQTFQNRPIYSAEIKITLDLKGNVKRIDKSLVDISMNDQFSFFNGVDHSKIKGEASILSVEEQEIIVIQNGKYSSALEVIVVYDNHDHVQYIFDKEGNKLVMHNLNMHLQIEKDTLANVVVFQPDPMTKANVFWVNGDDYDMNDKNEEFLDPLRDTLEIEMLFDTNSNEFKLENDRCKIMEFSPPIQPIVTSSVPFFEYSRSHYGFEEVNAYYHITNAQKDLVSMGFDLVDYKIEVDANALGGQDNSMFSTATNPPRLFFGEGGVDDAEDADVVIHEYYHAVSNSANGGTNFGTERRCLDEAIGDYFGCSYSYSINPFKWENVFTWDGHNQYWSGRRGDNPNNKTYPVSFTNGNIYTNTDLYVCALMEVYFSIGRFKTDQLVTESLYGYFSNMTFTDAALLVVQADSAYNAGVNVPVIWRIFYDKGILPSNPVSIYENNSLDLLILGTQSFAFGENLTVVNKVNDSLLINVFDLNGREVLSLNSSTSIKINGADFESGVYLLVVENDKGDIQTEKLVKY